MRSMQACAAISAAMLMACGVQHTDGNGGQPSGSNPNGAAGSEPGGVAAACPLGVASFTSELGLSDITQVLDLALDASGDAFVGNALLGASEVSAFGRVMPLLPAGAKVAVDAAGNVFIAGSFTAPLDLGAGVMVPQGNSDVFVAKLDAKGRLVFAKQLALCGDGLTSLAIARDGRIAVSGAAMGTAILSASGDVALVIADAGFVAFDSKGNLVIAETLAAGVAISPPGSFFDAAGDELVVLKIDATGNTIFRQSFPALPFSGTALFPATFTGVAIDAMDRIALVGFTGGSIAFFGTTITARYVPEGPGRVSGGFLVELDSACSLVRVLDLGIVEANAVAFDARSNVFVAGAVAVDFTSGRQPTAFGVDTRGALAGFDVALENVPGRASGIAIDACAGAYVAFTRYDTGSAASPVRAVLAKLSQ